MKILVQENEDRDIVGLMNALAQRHEVLLWDSEQDISNENPDLAILSTVSKLGYKTFNALKNSKILFVKCIQPPTCKGEAISIEKLPICADTLRYPPAYYDRKYACDIFYFHNWDLTEKQISTLLNIQGNFRIAGNKAINIPNYIGSLTSTNEVTKLCVSAGICIDFGLRCAYDLLKAGCRVITDTENEMGISVFTRENINDLIRVELSNKKPVLNKYDNVIVSYSQFLTHLSSILGMQL